jgi:hypothetical protein
MADVAVQASFNSGEWSPNLYARVDMQKYRSGAALLQNFFVDYRGGASSRPGTKYVLQAYQSQNPVRVIPFQASFAAGYVLEFGTYGLSGGYIRFYYDGAPIVETSFAITGATQANPCVLNIPGNNYSVGDWIAVNSVVGMTQLNGRYFQVIGVSGNFITIGYLSGANLDSTAYGAYASGGTAARIYTVPTPYTSADNLRLLKFAQSVGQMIICHPNYPPYALTLVAANNWTFVPVVIGATVNPPGISSVTSTLGGSGWNYAYAVTSIDVNGQESAMSNVGTMNNGNIRTTAGSNQITWVAAPGAVAYNVYEATISAFGTVPSGVEFGFIGTCKGTTFIDSNIAPDFTQTPPIPQSPFIGAGITNVSVTNEGSGYTSIPTIYISGSYTASPTLIVAMGILNWNIPASGNNNAIGDILNFGNGILLKVTAVGGTGNVTAMSIVQQGQITSGTLPGLGGTYLTSISSTGHGAGCNIDNTTWGVVAVLVTYGGAGFLTAPTLSFSSGAAAATASLGSVNGNPTCPGFVQQRMVMAGQTGAPATFYMSQPGSYFNFNISDPTIASDAVTGTLVSGTLNTIKSIIGSFAGMIILTDKAAWVVNGGGAGTAITPSSAVANPQSYIGASDVPPIVANYDILFVQAKGSAVRDLSYNFYFQVFTGEDISVISSHLFFGYTIEEWAWAEQPYYIALAVRSDGTLLSLTFQKEQQFIGWSHHITQGAFNSVCAVTEILSNGSSVDAAYTVVQRTINGASVQYIERFVERSFPNGMSSAWSVDSGLQYSGASQLTFVGAESLAGTTVTGVATDSLGNVSVITPFVMPVNGIFTLPTPTNGATGYTVVTIGLGFVCQLQTLPLEIGEPSIQGKVKKITCVDIRVKDTLGLSIGSSFSTLVPMKDLVFGNVSSALTGQPNQIVSGLVSGDARTFLDPTYTVPGQYCFQQSLPWPATILGVFPQFVTEDRR